MLRGKSDFAINKTDSAAKAASIIGAAFSSLKAAAPSVYTTSFEMGGKSGKMEAS